MGSLCSGFGPLWTVDDRSESDWLTSIGPACHSSELERQLCELEEAGLLSTKDV